LGLEGSFEDCLLHHLFFSLKKRKKNIGLSKRKRNAKKKREILLKAIFL